MMREAAGRAITVMDGLLGEHDPSRPGDACPGFGIDEWEEMRGPRGGHQGELADWCLGGRKKVTRRDKHLEAGTSRVPGLLKRGGPRPRPAADPGVIGGPQILRNPCRRGFRAALLSFPSTILLKLMPWGALAP